MRNSFPQQPDALAIKKLSASNVNILEVKLRPALYSQTAFVPVISFMWHVLSKKAPSTTTR
ncbi:uncharacterized protein PHALS_15417 [Plasmopara halstedii]|uniref:Uncharacterized protein n=1 Tax=Plasmopara halstedii TaxID=4781 RepID=A0A0P1A6P9_PLAHL|nr:uncharacterized protein PHALS_15417 [Plasmopara halstedii]CEG35766.1 hypothetical protein PHALS_15417 [Plasmopara halstedii]|eukprot:XP_024572135.1 hypothetical protein PHALS_15417 [Plasmopara halstedii]